MWYHVSNFLIVVIEMVCCMLFFETFLQQRKVKYKIGKIGFNIILSSLMYVCVLLFSQFFILKTIVIIVIMVTAFKLYYNEKLKKVVILSVLYQGLLIVVDFIAYAFVYSILDSEEIMQEQYAMQILIIVVFGKMLLFVAAIFIRKVFSSKSTALLSDLEWIRFFFFPVFTIGIIAAIISSMRYIDSEQVANILFIIAIGMTGLNIMVFYLINDIAKRESRMYQSKLTQTQLQNELKIYQAISDNYNNQKKQVHEFKNQIMCIGYLLNDGDYSEAKKYVNKINDSFVSEVNWVDTNNVIVNAVINSKYQEATDKNIVFTFKINDLSGIKLEDEDIVAILSNLLNNAIEAAEKCVVNRRIKLKINQNGNELIIAVSNTYAEKLEIQNGEYKTTKTDKTQEHGIGIKNIIKAVKKYDGDYLIDNEDGEFNFMIIIPN